MGEIMFMNDKSSDSIFSFALTIYWDTVWEEKEAEQEMNGANLCPPVTHYTKTYISYITLLAIVFIVVYCRPSSSHF